MLEITRKNCFKRDLETIISDDSKFFWINLKDFEAETESKWLNMFNKHGNASTLKYRRELTPNIKFQPDRIFVRNDLFEQIIKSCKAINAEFTMLKEKLDICPYEKNYNEKEIIKFNIEESFNKVLEESEEEFFKELNKELGKESDKELNKESNNELNKETSDEELIEVTSPKNDESTTDWYDKNKFKKIVTTIDSNKFHHKNKTGKLKFNDINNLVNNIKNNTISERLAKQKLNALDEIRKVETKNKRLINRQKIVSSLVDDLLETIFNNNNNNNNNKSMNEDNNVSVNENDNVSVNKNDNDNKNDSESDSDSDSDNDDDDDHDHDEQYYKIKQINNWSKTIDKTKSFEQQIEILKTKDFLDEY